jgi:ATP-dependent helicase/nuclease subunit A
VPADDPRLRRPLPARPAAPVRASGAGGADSAATARGSAVHLLLQRLSEGRAGEAALAAELRAHVGPHAPADFKAWLAQARAVLAAPELARFFDPARYRRAWNEVPLTWEGGAATVDRLVDDGAALWVLDYKTHARPDAPELLARYRPQLEAYAAAVGAVWPGRAVRAGLVLTATRVFAPLD